MRVDVGMEIYYHGDMANIGGFGVVIDREESKYGVNIKILMEDDRWLNVSENVFDSEYKGHGGTRFVLKDEYKRFRKVQMDMLMSRMNKNKGGN
jgi:hypothetical protein